MKLYVEGGGDTHTLRSDCRKAFRIFLSEAGMKGSMPKIVACGGRQNAYDSFCTAVMNREEALLLVDSESPVEKGFEEEWQPWRHLKNRCGDRWDKPDRSTDADCHLMVQCMEAWIIADRTNLQEFFGQGFNTSSLPAEENEIESISKKKIYKALYDATKNCNTKGKYDKGKHSFDLLASTSVDKVTAASPWAKRFIDTAKKKR